jgi:hypothetical protein
MGNAFNADRGVRGVPRSRHAPDFTGADFVRSGQAWPCSVRT